MSDSPAPILIRDAVEDDAAFIAECNNALAIESEGRPLDLPTVLAGTQNALAKPEIARYFIAERGGQSVGQTMITFEWSDWRNGMFWWIQSVYVVPDHRRQGVFSALFEHINQLARHEPEVCGIRLYVEDHNAPAQKTYDRLGFKHSGHAVQEIDWSGLPAIEMRES